MSELNELSRKTLKSYVSKANKDFKKNVKIDDHDTIHTSNPRKYMKRSEMIDAAKDKLQEESMNEQTLSHADAFKSETDTMKPNTKQYVGRKGGKEVHAKKDARGNVKFYHRDGIKGSLNRISEQTLELIDAIESGKSTAIETSFNEIMANKLVSAIDNRRQEIASGLFDMQEETIEEGVVPGSVKKDAKGNVLSFKTAPEDKRPDYQKKSFHELAMGANRAHVKMVAAKKRESGALPSDSANVRNLISQGR